MDVFAGVGVSVTRRRCEALDVNAPSLIEQAHWSPTRAEADLGGCRATESSWDQPGNR